MGRPAKQRVHLSWELTQGRVQIVVNHAPSLSRPGAWFDRHKPHGHPPGGGKARPPRSINQPEPEDGRRTSQLGHRPKL